MLTLATHRLWFFRDGWFPNVPSDTFPFVLPAGVMTAISVIVVTAACVIAAGHARRMGWAVVATGLTVLFVVDQAHLQPWAYLVAVFAFLFAVDGTDRIAWHRWIAVSVYFWSGLGKLDFQFAHTLGQEFLAALTWNSVAALTESTRTNMALTMPFGEMVIAIGLVIPKTRRIAAVLAIAFHLTLIGILGPWSLGHSLGVLVWNAVLIGQVYFLFWLPKETEVPRSYFIATVVCGLVIVGPALERRGHWDHWLAWSLYAPHTSRVDVEFAAVSATKLPTDIGKHLRDDHDGDGWRTLDLAAWSLVSRGVPIYPQGRYQLRLIQSLMRQHQMQNGIRVRQRGVADRMTGRRIETRQIGKRILP